jgi:hypothetical protein
MRKRGLLTSHMMDFFAYLFFVLVIIFFYVLFTLGSKQQTQYLLTGQVAYPEVNMLLLNVLRTPFDSNTNLADLVAKGVDTNDFKAFETLAKPVLAEFFSSNFEDCCWKLSVSQAGTTYYSMQAANCADRQAEEVPTRVSIPSLNPNNPKIDVTLSTVGITVMQLETGGMQSSRCSYKK